MVKKTFLVALFVGGLILSWTSCVFAAYTIDGNLSDWGINPFVDWLPGSPTADFVEEDWTIPPPYAGYIGTGPYPPGAESCDIEALYFDDDPQFFYLALVSSYSFGHSEAADIAIDFACLGDYKYGLKTRWIGEGHSFVDVAKLKPGESWTNTWRGPSDPWYLEDSASENIGLAEVHYLNAAGLYDEPGTDLDTFVTEAKISRFLFDESLGKGDTVCFHHSMGCGNDWVDLEGDFDTVVPEPLTLTLLSLGMLGIGFTRMRGSR